MDSNIVSLLVQVPILGVFIWYSSKLVKDFTAALDRRDELYEKRNCAIVEAMNKTTAQLTALTEMIIRVDAAREPPTQPAPRRRAQ